MRKLKRVCIYWRDASNYSRENDIDWLKKHGRGELMAAVGHLIKSGRKYIIAHEITGADDARNTSVIYRRDILAIEDLGKSSLDIDKLEEKL